MKVSELEGPVIEPEADSEACLPPHNDQYGKLLGRRAIDDGEYTYQVAVIYDDTHGHGLQLDLRGIWWRNRQPRYGKGFRIKIKNGHAEDLLATASHLIGQVRSELESMGADGDE